MNQPQAVIRDRRGTVHRVACLHRHAHPQGKSTVECSVWEIMTGTEAAFDVQILLDDEARRAWAHDNPDLPFCPGVELPEPIGTRRFGGAVGVVEAVLHSTDLNRNSRILVGSGGQIALLEGAESAPLRDGEGAAIRIELSLPAGCSPI